jgi:hypothetical protein
MSADYFTYFNGSNVALYPYDHAYVSFAATIDGEPREVFTFVRGNDADKCADELRARGCSNVKIGRTEAIEHDDEAGYPDFRAWLNAIENSGPRRIGARVVVLRAR